MAKNSYFNFTNNPVVIGELQNINYESNWIRFYDEDNNFIRFTDNGNGVFTLNTDTGKVVNYVIIPSAIDIFDVKQDIVFDKLDRVVREDIMSDPVVVEADATQVGGISGRLFEQYNLGDLIPKASQISIITNTHPGRNYIDFASTYVAPNETIVTPTAAASEAEFVSGVDPYGYITAFGQTQVIRIWDDGTTDIFSPDVVLDRFYGVAMSKRMLIVSG